MDLDEYVENEMYDCKKKTLDKLSTIVHPGVAKEFLSILHYAYQEDFADSKKIWEMLDFNKKNLCAISEDKESFYEILRDEWDYNNWQASM